MDESTARSRHPDSLGRAFLWALLPSFVLFLNAPDPTYALVETNITATTGGSLDLGTIAATSPTVATTTQITGGTRPGNGTNLFHSFDSFTLGTGDVAHFMNNMQLPTTNIIARVIGKEVSTIDGTLRTNIPGDPANPLNFGAAHLWLVNPSGLLLGPNARVEVGGSVSLSTANYLRFENPASLFNMLSTPASLGQLSVAPVVAFGFLPLEPGVTRGTISVQGSILDIPQGQALSLVGGDITIQAGSLEDGTIQAASLRAPGGQLNLVSVASPGEVLVPGFQTGSFTTMGTVTLKEGATLDVSGQRDEFGTPIGKGNSGTVFVRGGQLVMETATIRANTVGAVDGERAAVDIQVSQDVALSSRALISVATFGSGRGGDVVIAAGNVHLDASTIITGTSGPARGGDVQMTADSLTLENRSRITTATSGLGVRGGDLSLNVGTLRLLGGSLIRSTNSTGTDLNADGVADVAGVGGDVNVTVQGTTQGANSTDGSAVLAGGSGINSLVTGLGGDGGRITITAKSLVLDEASTIKSTTTATGTDLDGDGVVDVTGRGGNILVAVQHLSVLSDAIISSSTGSAEQGAAAGGTVTVQGLEGAGSKAGSVLLSRPNTGIVSDSVSGSPGDLTVNAGTLTITNGAVISAGGDFSTGPAGKVTVTADSVVISADGQIFSRSFSQSSGQVTITADALTLDNGSIDTSTSSETGGRGGDVVLNGGTVSLTNGASISSQSGSVDAPFSTGRAGDITITGESLTLANHSEITSSSKGTVVGAGDAGTIIIQSGSTVVLNDSSITTEASQASGGQIKITAPEMVRLTNSRISTSVADGTGGGGNIKIDPQFVILQNSQIIAQAFAGAGGAINIIAISAFISDPFSIVNASSTLGISGTVNIQSPLQNIGGELTALTQEFSSAAALLAQQCAARAADGKFSTFVVAAREGLPMEPGGFLASPSWATGTVSGTISAAEMVPDTLSPPGQNLSTQFSAVTGLFQKYDAKPIQLAKLGNACR